MNVACPGIALPIALSALAVLSPLASASIVSVSGQTILLGSPPASSLSGALAGPAAFAWDEKQNIPVSIAADMINNPGVSTSAIAGPVSGVFDSHFIHFQDLAGLPNVQGSVTFNNPIAAVYFNNTSLDNTDALCGSPGTAYPTGYVARGVTPSGPSFFSINGNVLTFNLFAHTPAIDLSQLRVLTKAPAPGPVALLGMSAIATLRRRRSAAVA